MSDGASTLKTVLKRGALLTAANWPVVLIQLVADTTFQALFAIPVVGAAMLVAMLFGADIRQLLQGSLRDAAATVAGALISQPIAFGAFVIAFALVLLGGSVLVFLIKGGTVTVLLEASRTSGSIEHPPLHLSVLRRASRFSLDRFTDGCVTLFRPYLWLGLLLMLAYAISGAGYLGSLYVGYAAIGSRIQAVGWTIVAGCATLVLIGWISAVNLIYLLLQIAIASAPAGERRAMRPAFRLVGGLLRHHLRELAAVFLVVLLLVIGATVASALAWSGVGLIAFVPVVGIAVVPLQLLALVVRGVVFEYLGLMALGAYLSLFRTYHLYQQGAPDEALSYAADALVGRMA
ncbi:MAG TPA: hypothetical protein VIC33_11665 [Vicinamibacterales bacterium]|jgi:hypothetical protein